MDDQQQEHPFFRSQDDEPAAEQPEQPEEGGSRRRWLRTHVLLGLVVASSATAIWMMRQHGIKSGMDFQNDPVAFESEYTNDDHERFERVLAELEEGDEAWQVPVEQAGANPFFLGLVEPDEEGDGEAGRLAAEEAARREAERRRDEIESALGGLVLQTVITGRKPMATINDTIVRVGDDIDIFEVVEINTGEVVLMVDDQRHAITPATHGPGSKPRRRR